MNRRPTARAGPGRNPLGTSPRTLRTAALSAVARAGLSFPLTLVFLPLVVTAVGTTAYGTWVALSSLLAVGSLADAGVRTETTRRVAVAVGAGDLPAARQAARQGASLLAIVGLALAAVAASVGRLLVDIVLPHADATQRTQANQALVVLTLLLVTSLVSSAWFSLLNGSQHPEYENAGFLVTSGVTSVATLLAAVHLSGLRALTLGALVGTTAGLALQRFGMARLWPGSRLRAASLRGARGYAGVASLLLAVQVCAVVDVQFDKLVLAHFVGAPAAGQYQIGSQLPVQGFAVATLPAALLLAGLAELLPRDRERAERLYDEAGRLATLAGVLVLGGVAVFGPAAVDVWLGPGFSLAGRASSLLGLATLMSLVTAPWYFYCVARRWTGLVAWSAAANALVNVTASYALTLRLGFDGSLYGSLAGNAVGVVVFWLLLSRREPGRRWLRLPIRCGAQALPGAALVLLSGLARPEGVAHLTAGVALFTACFVACALASRTFSLLDARDLLGRLRRV